MIRSVIILDNHIQGLGICRICGQMGLEVILFNHYSYPITRFSRYCKKFYLYRDSDSLISLLENLEVKNGESLIFPTNDKAVKFVSDNHKRLSIKFHLSQPDPDIVNVAYNKRLTYEFAEKQEIPQPRSFFPGSSKELITGSEFVGFPLIIKPAVMHHFYSKTKKKVFLCRDTAELEQRYSEIIRIIPSEEVILQEFIPGGAANLYSFGSFCNGERVVSSFVANRVRQKPMDFGISTTFARSVVVPQIDLLAIRFLTSLGYFGVSEVEFMLDSRDNKFKLLEINPRTWKWHTLGNMLDINLIYSLIKTLEGEIVAEKHNEIENIGWIEHLTDFFVALSEVLNRRMSLTDYFNSLKIKKEWAVLSRRDILPGIMYLVLSPVFFFKR